MEKYEIVEVKGIHSSGTKFYNFYLLYSNLTDVTVVIQNWGKVPKRSVGHLTGSLEVIKFTAFRHAESHIGWIKGKKTRREYTFGVPRQIVTMVDFDIFIRHIGILTGKRPAQYLEILNHFGIDPANPVSMATVTPTIRGISDASTGGIVIDEIASIPFKKLAPAPAPAPVIVDPLWGSW